MWTDSAAAIGICSRQGLGKLRHIATHTLWVQEKVRVGAIELRKVHGKVNPADLFTKHLLGRDRVEALIKLFSCQYREGRAASAPKLKRKEGTSVHVCEAHVGHDGEEEEGPMHDPELLPHHYSQHDRDELFPVAVAPLELEDCDDAVYDDWGLEVPNYGFEIRRARRR